MGRPILNGVIVHFHGLLHDDDLSAGRRQSGIKRCGQKYFESMGSQIFCIPRTPVVAFGFVQLFERNVFQDHVRRAAAVYVRDDIEAEAEIHPGHITCGGVEAGDVAIGVARGSGIGSVEYVRYSRCRAAKARAGIERGSGRIIAVGLIGPDITLRKAPVIARAGCDRFYA